MNLRDASNRVEEPWNASFSSTRALRAPPAKFVSRIPAVLSPARARAAGRLVLRKLTEFVQGAIHRHAADVGARRNAWKMASLQAHFQFQPAPYDGRVVLLQATIPVPQHTGFWVLDSMNGWQPFAGPSFEFVRLACDHHGVFPRAGRPGGVEAVDSFATKAVMRPSADGWAADEGWAEALLAE